MNKPISTIIKLIAVVILNSTSISIANANTATLNLDTSTTSRDRTGSTYTTIQWASSNTQSCIANGGWSSKTSTIGGQYIYPINQTTTFSMTCTGSGGSVTESITVIPISSRDTDTNSASLNLTTSNTSRDRTGSTYTTIQWTSTNTQSCVAIGGWSSKTSTSSGQYIYPINQTTTFRMTCTGSGGSVTESVTVTPISSQEDDTDTDTNTASLNLSTNKTSRDRTGSTYTTISWNSTDTQSCTAENGWTNRTSTSGSQYIYPINQTTTFSMTCTGSVGSVTESVTISVDDIDLPLNTGFVELNWIPPVTNQDGSQLNDLAGYRIYYGSSQNNLNNVESIDAGLTSYTIENLPSGTHYFSISAIDINDNESSRSNIAANVVN